MPRKIITIIILFWGVTTCFSQQSKIDSLLTLIKKDKEGINKVKHLNEISEACWRNGFYDSSIVFSNFAIKLSQQLNPPYKNGITAALTNAGLAYWYQGDYPKALDSYLKALKIDETLQNKNAIAKHLGNIGNLYCLQADYPKALDYYLKALKTFKELGDNKAIATCLGNIGGVYYYQIDYPKALDFFSQALVMCEKIGDKNGIERNLDNIGSIYNDKGDYSKALNYYLKALKTAKELGDKNSIATTFGNIGILYTRTGKFADAEKYFKQSIALSDSIGTLENTKQFEQLLSQLYDTTGRTKLAFEHYKKYIKARDSINNEENAKKQTRTEMSYEYAKKDALKDAKAEEEKRRQEMFLFSVIGGLLLVLVFSVFMFNRWRVTQRQKVIIEKQKKLVDEQKKIVEEHNKDITDSISYAQRIQKALLASDNILNKNLGEHFVLFKPKDIVSGDFYWATEKDGRFYLAVCDSTGHGVPGAFMSLLNISFLNEAISEKGIKQPNEVLNHARQRLIENLSSEGAKDGMDGILVCFDRNKNEITYAAAHNAPILITNGTLAELDSDNMPVGLADRLDSFKHEIIRPEPGTVLYLYTDGFADQFGGPKGKKFKYKQLNDLLLANTSKPMREQKDVFEKAFEDWKGNLEQIDDVLLIGIRT